MAEMAAWGNLLASIGHTDPLDAEVSEYIASVLTDPDTDDSSLDVLVEVLNGVPSFSCLDDEQKTQLVLQLLEDAKDVTTDVVQEQPCRTTVSEQLHSAAAAIVKASLAWDVLPDAACSGITNKGSAIRQLSSCQAQCDHLQDSSVIALLALCPSGTSAEYVADLLHSRCRGDVQAAADWLLECSDILNMQRRWQDGQQQELQQRQQAEQQTKQSRKHTVQRFDLLAVPDGSRKPKHGADILPAPNKGKQQGTEVRYRDGQVVSSKGEKYIIEKVGDEWDGGSRGKVYTKGKRGKGFQ